MEQFNIVREIRELKGQLSYAKKIGVFMGAGTSCALGLPNIATLTKDIESSLINVSKAAFEIVKNDLEAKAAGRHAISIEDILNQVRRIREITSDDATRDFLKVTGADAKKLDLDICKKIYELIDAAEIKADLTVPKRFFAWLSMQNRDFVTEIFTPNYDLIIERSLESIRVPYFDGFVGSFEPFFWQESVEKTIKGNDITSNWLRLWKIHGSLSWFWKENPVTKAYKVIRQGKVTNSTLPSNELVIYPSKEKYASSRRQPFIVYFDRLKNYLLSGELLFLISGYSFLDQHINEIIFNCMRQNGRLHVVVFFYSDTEVAQLKPSVAGYLNISVYGPKTAIIGGIFGSWLFDDSELKPKETTDSYWKPQDQTFLLGDFNYLTSFLVANSGRISDIDGVVNEN